MPAFRDRLHVLSATIIVLAATSTGAIAQKKYDTGATDTEIKIHMTTPTARRKRLNKPASSLKATKSC
jgi:branched-chain amino acid transport system substrate-binding protein